MANPTRVAVIGAGPGGYAAAFHAADLGMQVTLIDAEPNPGGICTFKGCIPSKALLHAAKVLDDAKHADAFGISFGKPSLDVNRLRGWKDAVVKKQTGGLGLLAKARKVEYIQGRASLVGPQAVSVDTGKGERRVEADYLIIATGSRPSTVPNVSIDNPKVLDSTSALDLPDIPGRLLVVGGGYIGLELGTVYAALGSKVTIVEMTDRLLPGADRDLAAIVARRMETTSEAILLETKVTGVKDERKGLSVTFEGKAAPSGAQNFDRVLVAVGRRPNSAIGGLEKTKVQINERGFIEIDGQRRTAERSIFAIGDVAGEPMLAHKATHEARVAVEAIAGRLSVFEPRAIPAVVYTDPELAWTGLTEDDAKKQNRTVDVAKYPWSASGRAGTLNRSDGLTKVIVDPETERVLGVGIVGTGAGELIAEGTLAIEMGALADDLRLTIHPHPTLSETVMEAADVFFGESIHVYKPKKA
ncbi:MAG TPA: dihydrolipoyl dehydrogenase [Vicinamibacterales bacterium]|jgi:dihydrolipoamide dehydrogenase|nr:dihydrolipoyl dehydrogenase [Vicinamibacterales bacterium]